MATLKTTLGLRNNVDIFNNRENAFGWASMSIKGQIVMLGDNNKFWVVCFADANKLSKLGYEIAA
jgi:hypothetical protein